MTASAKSVKGSTKSIDYLIEERKGYELERNLIYGDNSKEIMESFRMQQISNVECDKKFFTAYISPDPKDGQKLSDKELREISHDFMRGIGVNPEKQAYLAVVHTEKNHKHIHLLINRIDDKNKAIKDNFSVLKAQNTAHKIAKERGLISARDIMNKNIDKSIEKTQEIKSKIYEAHNNVMKIKPQTISKYMEYMKALGHEIKPTLNKNGEVQGFKVNDKKSGLEFKMSEIKREMSANNLSKELKYDLENRPTMNLKLWSEKNKVKNLEKSKGLNIT
ncbi:relaxase/mobilization nuclease domain-containing protein [Epilithonimonas sp.]|uniref:relaxase/mobilization nuclease domain-containing protein n=1 Tax=Epilithonimonas sp. TaxID=2894511 RepID=UPI002FDE7DD7